MAKKKPEPKKPPKLVPTLRYMRGDYLALAVLRVFRDNQLAELKNLPGTVHPANADTWAYNSAMLTDVVERTQKHWCPIAKKDATWFPDSRNVIARLYLRFRKRNEEELAAWEKELNASVQS